MIFSHFTASDFKYSPNSAAVLPIGTRSYHELGIEPPPGADPGAPVNPNLKRKFLTTTWISVAVFVVFIIVLLLRPEGLFFAHVFTHSRFAYHFEVRDETDWMSRFFFTGGMMPAHALFPCFQDDLHLVADGQVPGFRIEAMGIAGGGREMLGHGGGRWRAGGGA